MYFFDLQKIGCTLVSSQDLKMGDCQCKVYLEGWYLSEEALNNFLAKSSLQPICHPFVLAAKTNG
jgi:hypothetical protein